MSCRNSLVFLSVFCLFYWVFKGSQGEKILGVFEVSLGIFEKTKEKKDRGWFRVIWGVKRLQKPFAQIAGSPPSLQCESAALYVLLHLAFLGC